MTAAAAAASLGAQRVLLVERQPYLLHLQRGNHTRWLHPRIYDWPSAGCFDPKTNLPFLNWTAGTAGEVARQLLHEWDVLLHHRFLPIRSFVGASEVRIPTEKQITWNDQEGHHSEVIDAIVIATGFGIERNVLSSTSELPLTPSYWHNDDFDQPSLAPRSRKRRILISGSGDGALIDLLRLRIRDFVHSEIVNEFFPERDPDIRQVVTVLREIHTKIVNGSVSEPFHLEKSLSELLNLRHGSGPCEFNRDSLARGVKHIDARLSRRLRDDTEVVLNAKDPTPLTCDASLLHTFLTWRLLAMGVRYVQGTLSSKLGSDGDRIYLLTTGNPPKETLVDDRFDEVISRHGAEDVLRHQLAPIVDDAVRKDRELGAIDGSEDQDIRRRYLSKEDWFLGHRVANGILERFHLGAGSTELRNRRIQVYVKGEKFEFCEDEPRESTNRCRWRASVVRRSLEGIPSGPGFVLFRGEFGSGKSTLLLRYAASELRNPSHLVIDYSRVGTERSLSDATRSIQRALKSGTFPQKQLTLILDNFSESIRREFRRRGDGSKPKDVVIEHLADLSAVQQSNSHLHLQFILVVDDIVEQERQDDIGSHPLRILVSYIREWIGIDAPEMVLEDHPGVKLRKAKHSIGNMVRFDALRLNELFRKETAFGRYGSKESMRSECLFTTLRPIADYILDVAGFRAHPLMGAVSRFDTFLRAMDVLVGCLDALRTAWSSWVSKPSDPNFRRDLLEKHGSAWDQVFRRRLHLFSWLGSEWNFAEYLIVREYVNYPQTGEIKMSEAGELGLFLISLVDIRFDDNVSPGTIFTVARPEVPPTAYCNLISTLADSPRFKHLPKSIKIIANRFTLVRPFLETVPSALTLNTSILIGSEKHKAKFLPRHDIVDLDPSVANEDDHAWSLTGSI